MKSWTITWGGRAWTDDDVTAGDLVSIELLLGGGWANCDPWSGPAALAAMIAALECRTSGRPLDEVLEEVKNSPATELVDAINPRERDTAEVI